jgi:peptidoglycan hydrolase CwlO-like protein
MKSFFRIILFVTLFFSVTYFFNVKAVECGDSLSGRTQSELDEIISKCQAKKTALSLQANTLSSKIQYMDTQIYLTGLQINETEQKITDTKNEIDLLGSRIQSLDQSLNYLSKSLIVRIVEGYKRRTFSLLDIIFKNNSAGDLLGQIKYLKTAQDNNQKLVYTVQETKSNYEEQKNLREQKTVELNKLQATLESQKVDLSNQQDTENRLLAETQRDENTYQNLLSQAQAQLAGFGHFVSSQGGASLLSGQTVCDDWGCYYNQRDSQWGGSALNNTGYTIAGEGCLVTSMAMVYTHFGHRGVNPQTINSNSQNFASYYPAYLNRTITADGATSTRIGSSIDSELSAGRPVIVGISYDGGPLPDHFLVLISGSNGNYKMNDPFTPNGHNVPFTDHYSVGSIREIDRISI